MHHERWAAHLEDPAGFDPAQLTDGGSLPAVWAAGWAADPTATTLRVAGDGDDGAAGWWTAGRLDEATRLAAQRLAAYGLSSRARMVWSVDTSLDAIITLLGALRLGAVVVPANAAYTERELAHVVGDVRPALAIVDGTQRASWVASATPDACSVLAPDLTPIIGPNADPPGHGWRSGRDDGGTAPVLDRAEPDDAALIVFTSGTTGAPKGAVLTHKNLLAATRTLGLAWRWHPDDRLALALPLFHVHGLCAGLFGTLAAGASAVVLPRFSPEGVLDAASTHRASLFFGVPTMYHRLLGSGWARELARLRLCVSGSAPLPAPMWAEIQRTAGVDVLERYGMTETLLTVSNPYDGERRPGTVGFPLPGVETRVVPVDGADGAGAGPDTSAGQGRHAVGEGQLLVAGPTVFAGYWERPAATAAAFEGGWFRTGDVVASDADGYLAIRGRRNDLVISGGYNVYPAEVEDVLLGHPGVAEVAVVGQPSDEWGEMVVAWVVPAGEPPSLESLEALAGERLAPYKRPRRYRMVDDLPRNAMGKVQRDRLRD